MIKTLLKLGLPLLLLIGTPFHKAFAQPQQRTAINKTFSEMEERVVALVNDYRMGQDLQPLISDSLLNALAQEHSKRMASDRLTSHIGFKERTASIRKGEDGTVGAIAENIGTGTNTAEGALQHWLKTTSHRTNMLGNYTHTGVGVWQGEDGKFYFTQLFAFHK